MVKRTLFLKLNLFLLGTLFLALSCMFNDASDQELAGRCAQDFAVKVLNLQLNDAYEFCTSESKVWLSFWASSVTAEDMKLMEEHPRDCKVVVDKVNHVKGVDSLFYVTCTAYDVLITDSIGMNGRIADEASFVIPVVKRGEGWRVKMEGPLRSEM